MSNESRNIRHYANCEPKDAPGSPARSANESDAPKWLVALAKAGYGARGVIYVIIGGLAVLQATGKGGESTDSKGAIEKVLAAPGGTFILWALVVGLVGYAAWRLCQALLDADKHGTDAKGATIRAGLFVSALTHLGLAVYAGSLAIQFSGSSSGGGGSSGSGSETLVARILGWPGGPWIVGAIGLAIIGAGIAHGIKAVREKYKDRFAVDAQTMAKLNGVCKFGLIARGVAFLIIGGFFLVAATTQDPDDAGGLQQVLEEVSKQAFGPWLLGVLALGLMAFGLYSLIEMMYRRIEKPA